MPENKPIPDAELAEVKRLVAQLGIEQHPIALDDKSDGWIRPDGDAELGNWRVAKFAWSADANAALKLVNAFGPVLARLEAAERERDERTTMAARAQEALRYVMNGLPTNDAVWSAYGNADSARAWLAARDAQQRREGGE